MLTPGTLVVRKAEAPGGRLSLWDRQWRSGTPSVFDRCYSGTLLRNKFGLLLQQDGDFSFILSMDGLGWCRTEMLKRAIPQVKNWWEAD